MGTLKKLKTLSSSFAALIVAAILYTGCTCTCPNSPNPIVSFLEGGGFAVTPGQVVDATTVTIFTADGDGNAIDTVSTAPGQPTEFHYDIDVKRPVKVQFNYIDKDGKVLVNDVVSIEEIGGNGTPIVGADVVMGFTASPPQTTPCTNTTEIANGTGEVVVAWAPNDWFEVHLTKANGAVEKIGVRTEPSQGAGLAPTFKVYRSDSHQCLSMPTCNGSNIKAMLVAASTDTFYVVGTEGANGADRSLRIVNPANNRVIKVRK
jgi:hypothetical protein